VSEVPEPEPVDPPGPAPWWHAPWRLVVLGAAVAFLAAAVGLVVGA